MFCGPRSISGEFKMRHASPILFSAIPIAVVIFVCTVSFADDEAKQKEFNVHPIGYVRKTENKTTIVLDKKYEPGLLRMEKQSEIWVLWWFNKNDTPEKRSIWYRSFKSTHGETQTIR